MKDLPYFNPLTLAIRTVLYGEFHPMVQMMRQRNAQRPRA